MRNQRGTGALDKGQRAKGKKELTATCMQCLAFWAEKLSCQEVPRVFKTSRHKVISSVHYLVDWVLAHRSLDNMSAIGVDEGA